VHKGAVVLSCRCRCREEVRYIPLSRVYAFAAETIFRYSFFTAKCSANCDSLLRICVCDMNLWNRTMCRFHCMVLLCDADSSLQKELKKSV